jgi:hypothetical protein
VLKPQGMSTLENLGVGGKIKLDLGEIRWFGMDWIHLAQDRDQWRILVNTVKNFQVS